MRKKMERDPGKPERLVLVKGSGYLLRHQEHGTGDTVRLRPN
jgi:hypothetical protein